MNTPYKEVGIPSTPAALIMPMAVNHRISFVPPRATEFVSKLLAKTKKPAPEHRKGLNVSFQFGAPGGIRTHDPWFRRPML